MWSMSKFAVVCCTVIELSTFATAELGDETILLQHQQLTQHLNGQNEIEEAANSFLKSLRLHSPQPLAIEPSERGVSVNRRISTEPGGHVVFLLGPGCNTTDKYGTNNCTLTWNHEARLLWGIHAPSPFHTEDEVILNMTWELRAENVSSAARRFFTGRKFFSDGACKLCDGACSMNLWAEDGSLELNFSVPMILFGPSVCFALKMGLPIADFKITDWTMQLPSGPPSAWQLGGEGTASLALRNASGQEVLAQNITVGFSPSPGLPSVQLTRDPERPEQPKHFLQALVALHRTSLARAAEAIVNGEAVAQLRQMREDVVQAEGQAKLKHLVLEYWPKMFENADNSSGNFSLWVEPGCTLGEAGFTSCRLPFGQPLNLQLRVNFGADIEEDSLVAVTLEPKMMGVFGALFGSLLTPVQTEMPLCGDATVVSLGAMRFPYQPGSCGLYSLGVKVPSFEFTLPDFSSLTLEDLGIPPHSLPALPKKLVDFPGMTLHTSMLFKHSDGRPIADIQLKMGVER